MENITEELEESKNYSVYEDYKFLTNKDLEELGANNLIGTKLLKPYMHGFFMDWKLYKKLKAVIEPFDYEKYNEEKKQEKMNKLLGDRIVVNRNKKLKVNSKLAETNENLLKDERFSKLFKDKDYEIDFNSDKFKKSEKTHENNEITQNNHTGSDKIINPELVKLKEKLLSKKRQKIDNYYSKKEDIDTPLEHRINYKRVEDDEQDLTQKIRKLEVVLNNLA